MYTSKTYLYNDKTIKTNLSSSYKKPLAEMEILNGCGVEGIGELFTNFLRSHNYDVISIENAKDKSGIINFNYNQCKIIIYNKEKLKEGYKLSLQLGIDNSNIIKDYKNSIWDLALIIGKDYSTLNSFEIINKSHELF
jgi:hypothetical protein